MELLEVAENGRFAWKTNSATKMRTIAHRTFWRPVMTQIRMVEFPPLGNNRLVKDYPLKVKVLRKVIWHLCLENLAKVKNFLRLSHLYKTCLLLSSRHLFYTGSVLLAGTA